jgi:hypothetical protein
MMEANSFPLFATVNTLLEISHALLNITCKHVVFVDLSNASLDDLVANFGQETLHSFFSVVENTQFPDNSDSHQDVWKNFWDVTGLS